MQKIIVLFVATLLGLLVWMFLTAQPLSDSQSINMVSDAHEVSPEHDHGHGLDHHAEETEIDMTDSPTTPVVSESQAMFDVGLTYLDSYTLNDDIYGTAVQVVVDGTSRTMIANALANHEVGEFPRVGNPNTISAQDVTYTFPLNPIYSGSAQFARTPGVALNGVKFEPQTAERVTCATGEVYSIEAIQDVLNLGLDFNNAHVQPTGAYHYHAVADNLVETFDGGDDLVHVGFAMDGYLLYYSKSGAYTPSYGLHTQARTGIDCTYQSPSVTIDENLAGTQPDGTYVSDWQYVVGSGELDQCNGAEIHGQYAYLITDEYPYIPRCLMGEFTESAPEGVPPDQGAGQSAGGPPGGQGGERPNGPPPWR